MGGHVAQRGFCEGVDQYDRLRLEHGEDVEDCNGGDGGRRGKKKPAKKKKKGPNGSAKHAGESRKPV